MLLAIRTAMLAITKGIVWLWGWGVRFSGRLPFTAALKMAWPMCTYRR